MGQDSVDITVTRPLAIGHKLWYSWQEEQIFPLSKVSRLALDPPSLLFNEYHGLFHQR